MTINDALEEADFIDMLRTERPVQFEANRNRYPYSTRTPDALAVLAAEVRRLRAEAEALNPGEWTSALPTEPGWYWVRTAHDERRPGQLTPPRVELLKINDLARYWGEPFQCWSVPVEPPPLPEVK